MGGLQCPLEGVRALADQADVVDGKTGGFVFRQSIRSGRWQGDADVGGGFELFALDALTLLLAQKLLVRYGLGGDAG